ncbi:MAG: hypothetical protein NUV44_01070 [Candidatus Scalindua sp.]|nr:hypothetical protein [Candidatus Scalindua sp.]
MKARDYIPALKHGAKIMPEDLAGMIGLPSVGDIFYVDPSAGSDTANSGTSQDDALKTVGAAYAKATSGQHDVIIIAPTGGTGRTTETAKITWAKRFTHLIGSAAPNGSNVRAGMSVVADTGSTHGGAGFYLTENGCIFKNINFFNSSATAFVAFEMTGDYNYFENCHFQVQNATALDDAGAAACKLYTSSENTFVDCWFGSDTVLSTGANASLEFATDGVSGNARNTFRGCTFVRYCDAGAPFHVKADASQTVDRFVLFQGCFFNNYVSGGSGATMTDAMSVHATPGGNVVLQNSVSVGNTGWASNCTSVFVEPVYANTSTGLLVAANA